MSNDREFLKNFYCEIYVEIYVIKMYCLKKNLKWTHSSGARTLPVP